VSGQILNIGSFNDFEPIYASEDYIEVIKNLKQV
jgi:hypothetical protein